MVTLTTEECKAIYELIDQLSGFNPGNVFAWDGTDSMDDPTTSGCVRIFREAGKEIPDNLMVGESG